MAFTLTSTSTASVNASLSRASRRHSSASRASRARGLPLVPRASSADGGAADDAPNPIIGRKDAEAAARNALMGAIGNKRDVLSKFDGGGKGGGPLDWFFGGGGGGDENPLARKISFWIFLALLVLFTFKPVTAIMVNAVYYAFGWRTGREAPTEAELQAALRAPSADADVLSRYGADDDDDDDDDDA